MQRIKTRFSKSGSRRTKEERGVALITTLLLLMLLSGLALAMAWSTRSDVLISGFYRNYRGSFYAADSGLNVVRQAMMNQFAPIANGGLLPNPAGFVPGTQPIPVGTEGNIANAITAAYGVSNSLTGAGTGAAANSWPEQFKIVPNNAGPGFVLALDPTPSVACHWTSATNKAPGKTSDFCKSSLPNAPAQFFYQYNYSITVQGQSKGNENTVVTDKGILTIESDTTPQNGIKNFAGFGMFIDSQPLCSGTLVPGTITGPVFTNGSWNFGTSGKYTFTDPVQQANNDAGFGSPCAGFAASSGGGVAPTFQQGFNRNATAIALPQNSYNQEQAVLDGKGVSAGQVTNSQLNANLRNAATTQYPSGGTNTGVYLPYTSVKNAAGQTINTFTGGGIYVQGNAAVTLQPVGNAGQQYTIVQGGVTTTVTIDPVANTTSISTGGAPTVITGVPQMYDPVSGADQGYDTMLYVNGSITGLSGPAAGQAAIQNGTALTITAASSVTITGDILYKTEPVVMSGSNIDNLNPAGDTGQALGIFTASGNIDLHAPTSNGTMEIDASIATISQGGSGGLTNTGNPIGTLTIVGGRIQNTIQNINTTTRNVLFDRRYANGFSPPWYPSTQIAANGVNNAQFVNLKVSRLSWQNQTSY